MHLSFHQDLLELSNGAYCVSCSSLRGCPNGDCRAIKRVRKEVEQKMTPNLGGEDTCISLFHQDFMELFQRRVLRFLREPEGWSQRRLSS